MSRHARIELRPAEVTSPEGLLGAIFLKPSARPHYLRLVAANGQVLAHSENYSTRQNARRAVKAWHEAFFQTLGGDDPNSTPPPVVEFGPDGQRR